MTMSTSNISLQFINFAPQDHIRISASSVYLAAKLLGRKTSKNIQLQLEESLQDHKKTSYIAQSASMLTNVQKLTRETTSFTVGNRNYLERYMDALKGFCDGAGISLVHGVFLQSFADVACQTVVVQDITSKNCNVIHIEENSADERLKNIQRMFDKKRGTMSHDSLFSEYKKELLKNYRYNIVESITPDRHTTFFAYPGLCCGGPAFGMNHTTGTLVVADTLTPKRLGVCDLWANAIVSMLFDCGNQDEIQTLITQINKRKLRILGGYAMHVVSAHRDIECASYEFISGQIMNIRPVIKDGKRIIGQTNHPLSDTLLNSCVSDTQKTLGDKEFSLLVKRRNVQLGDIAKQDIHPTSHPTSNTKRLLQTIADPRGDVMTFDHEPAFCGFSSLYQAGYIVAAFTKKGSQVTMGKLTPPPITSNPYALVFDKDNPSHQKNKLEYLLGVVRKKPRAKTQEHVAIVYSMPSKRSLKTKYSETDEDSAFVAGKVRDALLQKNYTVTMHPIGEDTIQDISTIRADCIFNLVEWSGLDTNLKVKAMAQYRALNIPVTGATEKNFDMTENKILMKQALQRLRLTTPMHQVFKQHNEKVTTHFMYPLIVKPALEHCSMGMGYDCIVYDEAHLRTILKKQIHTFKQPAIAEEFIKGRELIVYLIEEKSRVRILPIQEIEFSNKQPLPFQTYESKWDKNHNDYKTTKVILAALTKKETKAIHELCLKTFKNMGFRGYARFDMRLRDGVPYILEPNANPCVYDSEDDPIPGISFPDFIQTIVRSAQYHFKKGWKI